MLPIIDRPLIQYAVDEAREAGIEQLIFVTGRGKGALEEHFDMAFELETTMQVLGGQENGAGGEIQLIDAMAQMIGNQPFHAVTFAGKRYDCGSKVGFVEATLAISLDRADMADEVRAMARLLLGE